MILISEDQAYERWDNLPDDLREALVSETTSDFILKTCQEEHISEEKISDVTRITGYVLFGFLHPEDLAKELRDALNIDIRITTSIANAINQRIFAPIRPQIDEIYKPPGAGPVPLPPAGMPKILQEIRPMVPVGASTMLPPRPLSMNAVPSSQFQRQPIPQPGMRVNSFSAPSPAPMPNLQKTDSGKIPVPLPRTPAPTSLRSPISPVDPAPFIMQNDMLAKQIEKAPDFRMTSDDRIASVSKFTPQTKLSARPAVLEFGGVAGSSGFRPPKPMPRAVDANNVPIPPAPQAGRKITEITGVVPGSAAAVPMPPKPPASVPTPQNASVPVPLPPGKM